MKFFHIVLIIGIVAGAQADDNVSNNMTTFEIRNFF
jgi:hypothetical protein